jgi:ankyrin repeat protein
MEDAIDRGDLAEVRRLVEMGEDVNGINSRYESFLLQAVARNRNDIVKFLLNMGAQHKHARADSMGPLTFAAYNGNLEIIKLLVDAGFNVNMRDKGGYSALGLAAYRNHPEVARFLLKKGADPYAATITGQTPISIAESRSPAVAMEIKQYLQRLAEKRGVSELSVYRNMPEGMFTKEVTKFLGGRRSRLRSRRSRVAKRSQKPKRGGRKYVSRSRKANRRSRT